MGDIQDWFIYIIVFVSCISLFFEFIILWLIHKIKRWNGFMVLIYTMTICNMFYDSFFLFYVQDNSFTYEVEIFLGSYGGLSVTIWTNVISFILFYTITTLQTVDIYKNYKYYVIISIVFPIAFSLMWDKFYVDDNNAAVESISWIYFWLRILSIVINIVIFIWIDLIIKALDKDLIKQTESNPNESITSSSSDSELSRNLSLDQAVNKGIKEPLNPNIGRTFGPSNDGSFASLKSLTNLLSGQKYFTRSLSRDDAVVVKMKIEAIRTLAFRMKYYPICQVIVRSVTAIRNYQINKGLGNDDNNLDENLLNNILLMIFSIVTPSIGFLFFIVFLIVQPKAKIILFEFFCGKQKRRTGSVNTHNSNYSENSNPASSNFSSLVDEEDENLRQSFKNILRNSRIAANNNNNGYVIEESDDGWLEYIQTMDEDDLMETISTLPGNIGNTMFAHKESEGNFNKSNITNRSYYNSNMVDNLNQSRLSQTVAEFGRENNSFTKTVHKGDL
jgi:hypothetical protein